MKKIPLEKLIRQSGETDYQKQYSYIIELEAGRITPVKAVGYLKYKNLRVEYIKAYFEILDRKKVGERYEKSLVG